MSTTYISTNNELVVDDVSKILKAIHRPAEANKDVSSWFRDETIEINFGETTGRPSADITLQREYLARFLETGWRIDEVLKSDDSGKWENVGGWKNDTSNTKTSSSSSHSISGSGSATESNSIDVTSLIETHEPVGEVSPYWTAYQKIRLKRRRMVAEYVLQTMVRSFNGAYNNGRQLEDERYNQIVSMYTLILRNTAKEATWMIESGDEAAALFNRVKNMALASLTRTIDSTASASTEIVDNSIVDINREFDAKIASEKAREISIGIFNSTIWPTTEAAYERQRQAAILNAKAEGKTKAADISISASNAIGQIGVQISNAANALTKAAAERRITATEMRNNVVKWMMDYMASRNESYPELEEQGVLVNQLGFSVGSAGSVL